MNSTIMMKNENKNYFTLITFILTIFFGLSSVTKAAGGLSLSQTRVVFDAKDKSTKVTINNQSDKVYLINSRILFEPDSEKNTAASIPFIVTPPLFRLEKESRNTVLISKSDTSMLPKERESLFYLSFLAIPSVKKDNENDHEKEAGITTTQVAFGIRTVIKLFYRPSDLPMPAHIAPEKLTFKQKGSQIIVSNPTPYYITLAELTVNGEKVNIRKQGAMIAPLSSRTYQVNEAKQNNEIQWSVINEMGGISKKFRWSP